MKVVVADSGVGMTPEERDHIFDRFYRARSASANSPGTGLGLSIVKSLVDLQQGKIEVESRPGEGTTFHVFIPAAVSVQASQSLEVIRGRKVLIIDDEREIAELITGQLAPLEIAATVANSGEEAMRLLHAERFDAITLDILMPSMDGFAVLREIRADPELRAMPIVFVSVFAGRTELSGEWVVSKPIDADELRDVLAAAVRAGRSRVLVVGRPNMQVTLEPALDELGIEHEWETTGAAAARVCNERRFEVALIDVGIRNPQAALQALDLRAGVLATRGDPVLGRCHPDALGYRETRHGGRTGRGCGASSAPGSPGRYRRDQAGRGMALRSEIQLTDDNERLRAEVQRLTAELARRDHEAADNERQLQIYAEDLRETFKQERARSQELTRSYTATVRALSNAVEARDAYTGKHAERVAAYGIEIARSVGLAQRMRPRWSSASSCTTSARSRFPTRSSTSRAP